jgi:hypothetical protein
MSSAPHLTNDSKSPIDRSLRTFRFDSSGRPPRTCQYRPLHSTASCQDAKTPQDPKMQDATSCRRWSSTRHTHLVARVRSSSRHHSTNIYIYKYQQTLRVARWMPPRRHGEGGILVLVPERRLWFLLTARETTLTVARFRTRAKGLLDSGGVDRPGTTNTLRACRGWRRPVQELSYGKVMVSPPKRFAFSSSFFFLPRAITRGGVVLLQFTRCPHCCPLPWKLVRGTTS